MTLEFFRVRLRQTRRTIQIIWESGRFWLILDIALVILQSLPPLALIFFTKVLIDKLTIDLSRVGADSSKIFASTIPVILGILLTMLIIAAARGLATYVNTAQSQKIGEHVGDLITKKSVELDLEYYENSAYQDMMSLAQQQAPMRLNAIVGSLIDLGQGIASSIAILGILLAFSPMVVLILIAAVIPGMVLRFTLSRRNYRWQKEHMSKFRLLNYLGGLLINLFAVKEVRLYNLGPHILGRYQDLRGSLNSQILKISAVNILVEFFIQTSATVAVIGIYAYIIYETIQHRITIGDMVMYYQLFQRGQTVLQGIVNSVTAFYDNSLYAVAVYDFMDLHNKMPRPAATAAQPFPQPIQTGIHFENVSFQYQGNPTPTFKNISLTIQPGEVIALVGANGAGKTTLIKLLCRLYDPSEGRITIDGVDLRDMAIEDVRRQIAVVFQDYLGYQLSATDNIWFGDVSIPAAQSGIQAAAELAGIHDKLSGLKQGYQTHLGRWLEDGQELSGGEWQKVALARLFFRNAPIVVLDEPTSAMDARAEYNLFLKFREAIHGKTAILISHRLSTVRMADRVYVLENGQILESGTHDELMARDETYAHLFKLQAQYYER